MKETKELATKKDLKEVEEKLSKKIDRNSERIDRNSEKIDSLSKSLDSVAIQVVKNSEAISKMVTKEEFNEFREEVRTGQDKIMTILTRLDQERVFTTERIQRLERDVEKNKQEIKEIKVKLAIS